MHFTLSDFAQVLRCIRSSAGTAYFHSLLPQTAKEKEDRDTQRCLAIIDSMTKDEREHPEQIHPNRTRRIARGSGTDPKDVDDVVHQFLALRSFLSERQLDLGIQIDLEKMQKDLAWGLGNPHVWSTVPFERKIWPLK